MSCAKIAGTLYAILGLLMGGMFSVVAVAGGFSSNTSGGGALGAIIGVGSVIVFPICYAALGFVARLIGAWLYNALAGMVGGIQLDVPLRRARNTRAVERGALDGLENLPP